MPLTRPKLQLDEESFQGLLSAAFTIQEHADLLIQVKGTPPEPTPKATAEAVSDTTSAATSKATAEAVSETTPAATPKAIPEAVSETTPAATSKATTEAISETTSTTASKASTEAVSETTPAASSKAITEAVSETTPAATKETAPEIASELKAAAAKVCRQCGAPLKEGESRCGECALEEFRPGERMQRKFASLWEMSQQHSVRQERTPQSSKESLPELSALPEPASPSSESVCSDDHQSESEWASDPPIELEHSDHSISLQISDHDSLTELPDLGARSGAWRSDVRQLLNRHRADLYLGIAILVAVAALLWPAPAPLQKPRLDPWQRVLVKLGIAEAPAPQVHYQGDPDIQVWVDPHTALYYCAGEDLYGKTPDGRLTTQRDAQADHFEPANRAACN